MHKLYNLSLFIIMYKRCLVYALVYVLQLIHTNHLI